MIADIENANLFMMCTALNTSAATSLPRGYSFRRIRPDELDIWKRMPFNDNETADAYYGYMSEWFERVYAPRASVFYDNCIFVCDINDTPVGTCFFWHAYGVLPTLHWFKVIKPLEGKGIGRALLSEVMKDAEYPIYLHTQPGSYRAIKLYTDFGFALLRDPVIGNRKNDIDIALPYLKERMPERDYNKLSFANAPEHFMHTVSQYESVEF